MADKLQCGTHGERNEAFVCEHLVGEDAVGLGWHEEVLREDAQDFGCGLPLRSRPQSASAWCDDCEIIRAAHDGWNAESSKLANIKLLCSGCYERARIRNTRAARVP